ncbi:hypothetical protein [Streptomyces sp. WMMC905]|uniref:hypothetical protein n=1 Tax=Streptomyces sp. WMMC905 TaxID=3404123 RepID=UPI003B939F6C
MEPRGYRLIVSTQQDFVATSVLTEGQLYTWLTNKRYDTSALDEDGNDNSPNVALDQDSASGRRGAYTRRRMRGTPTATSDTWQPTLVVRSTSVGCLSPHIRNTST